MADASAFDEAMNWAILLQDPEFQDWDAHLAWLEADPSHPELYRQAALCLADGLAQLNGWPRPDETRPVAANDDEAVDAAQSRRHRGWWLAAAAAMAASAAFILIPQQNSKEAESLFSTAPGEMKTLRFGDGTTIALNGGTAIGVSASDPRNVRLERGEVFVRVVHDASRPFQLATREGVFKDTGTAFNVRTDDRSVRLTVAEGTVAYDPEHANVEIAQGESLLVTRRRAVLSGVQPSAVGSWRSRRLVYVDADLRSIATDISRSTGEEVVVSDRLIAKRFTGVIPLQGQPDEIIRRLALLMQLSAVRQGTAWRIDSISDRQQSHSAR
jgi:transmembrane sensor